MLPGKREVLLESGRRLDRGFSRIKNSEQTVARGIDELTVMIGDEQSCLRKSIHHGVKGAVFILRSETRKLDDIAVQDGDILFMA